MKKAFYSWLTLILFSSLLGQGISGHVFHRDAPVPFALVYLKETGASVLTDTSGSFSFSTLAPANYMLVIKASGYKDQRVAVNLLNKSVTDLRIELEDLSAQLDEVVVSGTLREQSLKDSPIHIEVLTPKLFQKNPSPSLFDAIGMVNGVQPQLNCAVCNTGDIHINGMEGPYTMITIDGMPIVSSLSTVYGLSGIPNSIVQRIEVVKGPAGTLFGSEAVGGLINVITKSPAGQARFSGDLMISSWKEANLDLATVFKAGKKISGLIGLNTFWFNERYDFNKDNFTDLTLQKRVSLFNKWSFDLKNGKQATTAARLVYEDRFGGELNWEEKFRGGDSIYGESINTRRAEVFGQIPFTKKQDIQLTYSWNYHFQDSYYGTNQYLAAQQVAFAQLLWGKTLGNKHQLLCGLPLRFTYYDDNSVATEIVKDSLIKNKPQQVFLPGIFVQDEWSVSERWKILSGLRYDYHSIHGNIFSPRLAIKWRQPDNSTWRLSSGNGYRVVSLFTEDHAALTGSREVIISETLKPEKSWNGILSYTHLFAFKKSYLNLEANVFYTRFSNKIVGDFLSDPDKIFYRNLRGYAISKGQAGNLEWAHSNGLKVIAGYSLMDVFQMTEDSAGALTRTPQLLASKFTANFAVSFKIPRSGINLDLTGKVNSPMHLAVVKNDFRPAMSPWFCIMNFQLSYTTKKKFEIYGGLKNLLNFVPEHPLLRPFDPFDKTAEDPVSNPNAYTFDTSYNYAPLQGIRFFFGVRLSLK